MLLNGEMIVIHMTQMFQSIWKTRFNGGFHDAGTMLGVCLSYSAVTLGWGFYEFKEAFTATGQAAHAQVILTTLLNFTEKQQ